MVDVREKPEMVERALLVAPCFDGEDAAETQSLLEELEDLVDTLGVPVVGHMMVRAGKPSPKLLVGSGKADEIVARAREVDADVIVIDHDLSPAQQRNWESLSKVCVIDREEVILDIFGQRAHTSEARLQVELARMEYNLPRLTRAWTHLSRQSGGGGTGGRGEGEMQIEVDRRLVRRKISRLRARLKEVRKRRATQRTQRLRTPVPTAAIVGYTNAGKSSLLRRLTGADVFVENKLFATLDTTTRKIRLPDGQWLLLTDTVGFVRRLPHGLVESFKATLEEAVMADFLIHVVDASPPKAEDFIETTRGVLEELGADTKHVVTVFNKLDLVERRTDLLHLKREFPDAVFLSVRNGEGLNDLMDRLADMQRGLVAQRTYAFPHGRADLVSSLHRHGKVLSTTYEDDHVRVEAIVPHRYTTVYEAYELDGVRQA